MTLAKHMTTMPIFIHNIHSRYSRYSRLQTQQGCECVLTFIQFIKPEVTVYLNWFGSILEGFFFLSLSKQ